MKHKYWFKAKRYGWGWYPSSWQGWLILLDWLVLTAFIFTLIDRNSPSTNHTLIQFLIPFILLISLLIVICWKTGEKPRWRWGK